MFLLLKRSDFEGVLVDKMGKSAATIMMMGILVLCLWAAVSEAEYMKYKDPKQALGVRIKDLMNRMTLEEKVGQMTQIERKIASADVMKTHFLGTSFVFTKSINCVIQNLFLFQMKMLI